MSSYNLVDWSCSTESVTEDIIRYLAQVSMARCLAQFHWTAELLVIACLIDSLACKPSEQFVAKTRTHIQYVAKM